MITDRLDEATASLIYREALIYREWQDAIGDAMIDRDPDSPRRFRIIGSAAFSDLLGKDEFPWIRIFAASLDDIDFEDPSPRDFQALQLKRIANAAAAMLIAIQKNAKPSPVGRRPGRRDEVPRHHKMTGSFFCKMEKGGRKLLEAFSTLPAR